MILMNLEVTCLCLLFLSVAAVYSAAGFGGGSSYLAILSFAVDDFLAVRTLALLCNLVVVGGSVSLFWKHGFLLPRSAFPLVAASTPAAFIAAQLRLEQPTFLMILGVTLIAAAIAMFWQRPDRESPDRQHSMFVDGSLGGVVGFLAGLVGIGGGIFLSPLLHLVHWDTAKRIAAVAAFFILVNSIAGLAGLVVSQQFQISDTRLLWLLPAVLDWWTNRCSILYRKRRSNTHPILNGHDCADRGDSDFMELEFFRMTNASASTAR